MEWTAAKIIAVTDTRALVEDGDRFVRAPGTGDARECDRCGRVHEVHVTVADEAGEVHTVGLGCAHATGPVAARLKSAVSATRTVERLRAELARAEAHASERAAALPPASEFPGYVESPSTWASGGVEWRTPDGRAWCHVAPHATSERALAERLACITRSWQERVQDEAVPRRNLGAVSDLRDRLARAERKLAALSVDPERVPA